MSQSAFAESEPPPSIVVVDDEPQLIVSLSRMLRSRGYLVTGFVSPAHALEHLMKSATDVLLTDLHMPNMSGLQLMKAARDRWPHLPVLIMTGRATVSSAVDAMRQGAYDYLIKPFDPPDAPAAAVQRAVEHSRLIERNRMLQEQVDLSVRFGDIVGSSAPMRRLFETIAIVAPADSCTLVVGESGTGKELVARAIHRQSRRSNKAFVAINCGALTETVLESELFGHTRGAFTGAVSARRGLFEEASGGTLLLDEVGELSPATQVRLLRVLQEREVRPLGSNEPRPVDVRIIAATHRELSTLVSEGSFRQDLYYRLDVVSIRLPPLRERIEDVPLLAQHFLRKHAARLSLDAQGIAPATIEKLCAYDWPGNIRELENVIERALVLGRGNRIGLASLPAQLRSHSQASSRSAELSSWAEARAAFELDYLQRAVSQAGGNVSRAAKVAGLDRSNFRRLLKRRGLLEPNTD